MPNEFDDKIEKERYNSYSYSLNHNHIKSYTENEPMLSIIVDFAPIKMIITRKKKDLGLLVINFFGIVSGAFVGLGMINQLVETLYSQTRHMSAK